MDSNVEHYERIHETGVGRNVFPQSRCRIKKWFIIIIIKISD